MSGPKLVELRRMQAAMERQRNHDLCKNHGSEYARLVQDCEQWIRRLAELDLDCVHGLRPASQVTAAAEELLRKEQHHEAARIFGEEVSAARRKMERFRNACQERVVELQNRHRQFVHDREVISNERSRFEERMRAAIPSGWPDAERGRIESALLKALGKVVDPGPCDLPVKRDAVRKLEACEKVARTSMAALDEARGQLEKELNETHARLLSGNLGGAVRSQTSLEEVLRNLRPVPKAVSAVAVVDDKLAPQIEKILSDLAAFPESSAGIEAQRKLQEAHAESDPVRQRVLRESFCIEFGGRLKELHRVAAWREQGNRLIDSAAHVKDSAVDQIVAELNELLALNRWTDLEPLAARLRTAIAAAEARLERERKRRALIDSLKELGYETSENIETALVQAGRLVLHRPGDSEYGVEVVADTKLDRLQTALVRYAGSEELSDQQRRRDIEREESWCSDHARLRQKMAERGIEATFRMQLKPGEHPVKVIVDRDRSAQDRAASANNKNREKKVGD